MYKKLMFIKRLWLLVLCMNISHTFAIPNNNPQITNELDDEITKHEKGYKLGHLVTLRDDDKKEYAFNGSIADLSHFAKFIICMNLETPAEEKTELHNTTAEILRVKKEWEKEQALHIDFLNYLDSVIQECRNSRDCGIFDQEYKNISLTMNTVCSEELRNQTNSVFSGTLYDKWRYSKRSHFGNN